MTGTVLVTGGFGLVGSETVKRLAADGRRVVAADLYTPANVKAAKKLPSGVEFRWADLTDRDQVERMVSDIAPEAIIHLAAIIAAGDLPHAQGGAAGQRRCHENLGRHRRGTT